MSFPLEYKSRSATPTLDPSRVWRGSRTYTVASDLLHDCTPYAEDPSVNQRMIAGGKDPLRFRTLNLSGGSGLVRFVRGSLTSHRIQS